MFDDSLSKMRMREVERTARHLAESVGKLLEVDSGPADSMKQHFHEGCEHCRKMMHNLQGEARKKWDYSRKVAREKGEEIDTYAHEHVWTTVGIGAALGAAIGALLMKRRK